MNPDGLGATTSKHQGKLGPSHHPYVIGEISLGVLKQRREVLELMAALPSALVVSHDEVMAFVDQRRLSGRGIGGVDVHLAASAAGSRCKL